MSTLYRAPEEPAQPDIPTPARQRSVRRTWLQRIPTPAFVAGYGALVVAAAVLGGALVSYSGSTEAQTLKLEQPRRPFNSAPADASNVAASVRPHLIENAEVGATETGVKLRGGIAEGAEQMPAEFAGHVSRLLDQNCLDTVSLSQTDGMRLNFWGFCFSTIPPTTIEEVMELGEDTGADSVALLNFAQRSNRHEAQVNWMDAGDTKKLDALVKTWRGVDLPDSVDHLTLTAYGDEEVVVMDKDRRGGNTIKRGPAGEAFQQQWGR